MHLSYLKLQNFRNFAELQLSDIAPGLSTVAAPNGSGKSNLLEAVFLLATGFSNRTTQLNESIRWGQKLARIEGTVDSTRLAIVIQPSGKQLFVNEKPVDLKNFRSHLYAVSFQPTDLNLLAGSPQLRRTYLNRLLGQLDLEYLHTLLEHRRLAKHRNLLLKQTSPDLELMDVIEDKTAQLAADIYRTRVAVIANINRLLIEPGIKLHYQPSPRGLREIETADAGNVARFLREKTRGLREKEREIGFSLIGPQRDDFEVFVPDSTADGGSKNVGVYGSRGQQRLAIVHLKLAESQLLEEKTSPEPSEGTGTPPMLLLDDVLSELDAEHQKLLFDRLDSRQTFLTGTELKGALPNNHSNLQVF